MAGDLLAAAIQTVRDSPGKRARAAAVTDRLHQAGHHATYGDVLWALRVAEFRGYLTAHETAGNGGPAFSVT